ncbi:MAG: tRNA (cytidine(56)-2'-O)-methyltransferase [Halobacteriaceae archaeon]
MGDQSAADDRPTPGAPVTVLRLGHRPGRDDRMTTHVALTARALGARRVLLPENATDALETARDVTDRFGGPFAVEQVADPAAAAAGWDGPVAHLTMYGEPVQERIADVRRAVGLGGAEPAEDGTGRDHPATTGGTDGLLVAVGAEKVPFSVYERADWNLGVTNQPHSEVAALAVFLDRLFDGAELEREWADADRRVVPQATGKRMESLDG